MNRLDTIGSHKTKVWTNDSGMTFVKYHDTVVWRHGGSCSIEFAEDMRVHV